MKKTFLNNNPVKHELTTTSKYKTTSLLYEGQYFEVPISLIMV